MHTWTNANIKTRGKISKPVQQCRCLRISKISKSAPGVPGMGRCMGRRPPSDQLALGAQYPSAKVKGTYQDNTHFKGRQILQKLQRGPLNKHSISGYRFCDICILQYTCPSRLREHNKTKNVALPTIRFCKPFLKQKLPSMRFYFSFHFVFSFNIQKLGTLCTVNQLYFFSKCTFEETQETNLKTDFRLVLKPPSQVKILRTLCFM